jgi:hypothetical protein
VRTAQQRDSRSADSDQKARLYTEPSNEPGAWDPGGGLQDEEASDRQPELPRRQPNVDPDQGCEGADQKDR